MVLNLIKSIFTKLYGEGLITSNDNCTCGKYEKCIRRIKVKGGSYFGKTKLYVDSKDHFRCGEVQNQINEMKKSTNQTNMLKERTMIRIAIVAIDKEMDYETLKDSYYMYGQESGTREVWNYVVEAKEKGMEYFKEKYSEYLR